MRLLLDTCIYLWWINDDSRLSKIARAFIMRADAIYISSASIWEASIKINIGKLDANIEVLAEAIKLSGFTELPITVEHAVALQKLPNLHRDPFDRILLAQAITEPLKFVTVDQTLNKYSELVELVN